MAFKVVPVSKFEAPEPGFSGLWACCRDVRRSLSSSPPSFCFQPVLPPLRLWWFRGPAPCGLGSFPAPVLPLSSFVFVLAAALAACCAAMALEVFFSGDVLESWGVHDAFWKCEIVFSGDELEFWGVYDAFWKCEIDFSNDVLESWSVCDAFWKCETDFGGDVLESWSDRDAFWICEHVDDGYENVNLGSGSVKDCLKDIFQKTLSHERKVATFEFQALPLFDLLACLVCNLAVVVALQVQAFQVGAKTHKVSGEVEEKMKKEGEEEKEYTEEEEETKEKQDEWETHAFSLLSEEEENERKVERKDKDMLFFE